MVLCKLRIFPGLNVRGDRKVAERPEWKGHARASSWQEKCAGKHLAQHLRAELGAGAAWNNYQVYIELYRACYLMTPNPFARP